MQALTISELEQASGVPRSTIYFYVREGFLPAAQKAAASRAIYSDVHLDLLEEIRRLKDEGRSLDDIRSALQPRVDSAGLNEIDLVARQVERTQERILEAAARQFARKGYRRTRIADVIREVGISPPVFYGHFRTKRQLFARSFNVFAKWMNVFIEGQLTSEKDPVLRILSRIRAFFGLQSMSENMLWLARFEALHEGGDARKAAQDSFALIIDRIVEDLAQYRQEGSGEPDIPDELLAYSLLGALEISGMRASWDDKYSPRDIMWTHLHVYLAVRAMYSGKLDVSAEAERYRESVERLAGMEPPVPPAAISGSARRDAPTEVSASGPNGGDGSQRGGESDDSHE
jgi:AcrR family transcriptional regulator